jgi:hypothetical protein
MTEPLEAIAVAQMFAISMELETQLAATNGLRPVMAMLQLAKIEAAAALVALVNIPPTEGERIREKQYEVRRFEQLCDWIKQVIQKGLEADKLLTEKEREELLDILVETEEGEEDAVEMGLVTREGTYAPEQS